MKLQLTQSRRGPQKINSGHLEFGCMINLITKHDTVRIIVVFVCKIHIVFCRDDRQRETSAPKSRFVLVV